MLNQLVTTTSILGPAWSLSLECWFYALLPLLATQSAGRLRAVAWGSFAAFAVFTVGRTLLHLPYYSGVGFGANALLLAFAWVTGSRLARLGADALAALRDLRWMFAAHLALDALIQLGHRIKHHEGARFLPDDLPGFCLHALTLWVVLRCFARVIAPGAAPSVRSRWMNALGDWSYPLYLVHVPLYAIIALAAGVTSMAKFGVLSMAAFGAAVVAAAVLHQVVERPWRRSAPTVAVGALARES
jgi:peptidoglycan/LPS O-acetylase OafA/YrhL